jgi:hypothetical protein
VDGNPKDWLPDSFFQPPNWRWLLACWLAEQGNRVKHLDDWVRRARHHLASTPEGTQTRRPRSA